MSDLVVALGLVLVIEGALYALFPGGMQRMMAQLQETAPATLRVMGLGGAVVGFIVVWIAHG